MATNMCKNSSKNVEFDSNKILYETLLDFFLQRNGTYCLNKRCTMCIQSEPKVIFIYVFNVTFFSYPYVI